MHYTRLANVGRGGGQGTDCTFIILYNIIILILFCMLPCEIRTLRGMPNATATVKQ